MDWLTGYKREGRYLKTSIFSDFSSYLFFPVWSWVLARVYVGSLGWWRGSEAGGVCRLGDVTWYTAPPVITVAVRIVDHSLTVVAWTGRNGRTGDNFQLLSPTYYIERQAWHQVFISFPLTILLYGNWIVSHINWTTNNRITMWQIQATYQLPCWSIRYIATVQYRYVSLWITAYCCLSFPISDC